MTDNPNRDSISIEDVLTDEERRRIDDAHEAAHVFDDEDGEEAVDDDEGDE